MERVIIKHLRGSKANQIEEFPLNNFKELTFGRDPSSTIKYDPDRDDLVGRQQAKLIRDDQATEISGQSDSISNLQFTVTDLNSRNGTFVNKQRIVGSVKIWPGDIVQFGPGGPEFQFDIEPRPQGTMR